MTTSMLERMRGLLLRTPLEYGEGLLIAPCNSVHTFGMRYAIDLVYLDKDMKVLKLVENLLPWRLSACRGAASTLELKAGSLAGRGLQVSGQLVWRD